MAHSGKHITFDMDIFPSLDDVYSLGNKDFKWKLFGEVQPQASKVYPAYTCSANDANKAILYFGKINIKDTSNWYTPWMIHYRLYVKTDTTAIQGMYDCTFSIQGSTVNYYNYNNFFNGSNYPIYSHRLIYPKSGHSSYGGFIGARVQSAHNVTTTARIFTIEILETKNCTVDLFEEIKRRDEIYVTTDGIAASTLWYDTDYNGTSLGLQEQGDANSNTYDRTYVNNNKKARVAIVAGSICVGDETGYAGIDEGVTFDITYPILYMGTAMAAGAQRNDFYLYQVSITSTVNTTGLTHVANGILYMTGTLEGATFTCHSKTLTYTTPTTEDGLIYIPVGINTNGTTQSFYFLGGLARMFWYKDGAFRPYTGELAQSTYGNINSDGTLQDSDITIANGDKLVVTDATDSNKIARASLAFDGSTKTQALSKAGTWEPFLTSHQTYTAVSNKKPTGNQTPGFGDTFDVEQVGQAASGQVSVTERTVKIPATIATNTAVGLVKPWYSHTVASTGPTTGSNATAITVNAIQTTANRYYAIESDSNGRLFVNVPWTNVNSSYLTAHNNLVKQTLKSDNVKYNLLASAQATPTSGTAYEAIYNTDVFINPSLSAIGAKAYIVNEKVTLQWNSTDSSLDFVFA